MIELTIEDMTCGHCASVIQKAVQSVDATSRCEVDLGTKRVRLTTSKSVGAFVDAIARAGYHPVATPATP